MPLEEHKFATDFHKFNRFDVALLNSISILELKRITTMYLQFYIRKFEIKFWK